MKLPFLADGSVSFDKCPQGVWLPAQSRYQESSIGHSVPTRSLVTPSPSLWQQISFLSMWFCLFQNVLYMEPCGIMVGYTLKVEPPGGTDRWDV